MPGGYWLWPARMAAMAASITSGGPSSSGNPWPRLIEPVATASADISAKIVVPKPCMRVDEVRRVGHRSRQPATKLRRTWRRGLSRLRSTSTTLCHTPSSGSPSCTGSTTRRRDDRRQHVVGAVAGRAVRVAVAVVARQQPLERVDEVVVGAGAGLDDGDARGRVRREHVDQPVAARAAERAHVGR